ncbi:hypothetical protein [Candidatus Rariloculus sp.]|uniref:hypothetical protein n=1 Tax=Candidatus Rariloculus sp. TaxID=3101265 RepID=UPI003D118E34
MLRLSIPWITRVISSIQVLENIQRADAPFDIYYKCAIARANIDNIFSGAYAHYLKASQKQASELTVTLDQIINAIENEVEVTEIGLYGIRNRPTEFANVLLAELNVLPSFLVTEKEGYNGEALVSEGYKLFPPSTLAKCPETRADMSEAGKALAFELATACGFHVFRVTEAVLKRYWDHVSKGKDRTKIQGIGSYASELEKNKLGEAKVWETLKQLARLHRNPLIHPEVILSVEEAITTLGIARSAISTMLASMPDVQPTTANPTLGSLIAASK